MNKPNGWIRIFRVTAFFNKTFFSRLGGAAGLLGLLAIALLFLGFDRRVPAIADILQNLPNMCVILWLIGIAAIQSPRLSRLGSLGVGTAIIGLSMIIAVKILLKAANVNPDIWVSGLLNNPGLPWVITAMVVLFVWGILALGTASLQIEALPRGAVVIWMVGLMVLSFTSWTPILLATEAGIVWSSIILLRGVPLKDTSSRCDLMPDSAGVTVTVASNTGRFIPLDALRGIIMILMAIDHASIFIRRWHPFETWDQPLPVYPSLAAMLTRLATHPCAPGFYFLMGAGMVLFSQSRRQAGWSERKIIGFLALRGLLFIVLEQLIVDLAINGQISPLEFSILAGLGMAMLLGIPFLRLNGLVQVIAGGAILIFMQVLPGFILHTNLGFLTPIRLLLVPGSVGPVSVLYPPIPWLGIVLIGMAFARLLLKNQQRAYQVSGAIGLACLVLFPLVRFMGGFGNLRMPTSRSLIDFFNVVKYPPSLSFLLLSLGIDLVVLYLLSRTSSKLITWGKPLIIFGQGALFFFLVHWFIYSALGVNWSAPGGLPQTYLAWIIGLLLLFPVCKAFEMFKHGMPATSVWRML